MKFNNVKYILTDIEGTTTSVKFVYDCLFPYFREHLFELKEMLEDLEIQKAFKKTTELSYSLEGKKNQSIDEVLNTLLRWSLEDRKITPLKTLQGKLWEKGYNTGEIKGHVYEDVPPAFEAWKNKGLKIGIFSSGSIAAQKLLFTNSEAGDLSIYLSNYFDTTTGGKREEETYSKIAEVVALDPSSILFLSDIVEELEAADVAGFQTLQLVRPGTEANWSCTVEDFNEINIA